MGSGTATLFCSSTEAPVLGEAGEHSWQSSSCAAPQTGQLWPELTLPALVSISKLPCWIYCTQMQSRVPEWRQRGGLHCSIHEGSDYLGSEDTHEPE